MLRTADFRTAYDKGIRLSGPLFAAFCVARTETDRSSARLGLTVPRAVGGAVVRNRIRRRTKAAIRQLSQGIPGGAFLITTEPEVATMEFAAMREDLESALHAAARAKDDR